MKAFERLPPKGATGGETPPLPEVSTVGAEPPRPEADFSRALIEAARSRKSWRERLLWVRDRFADPTFAPTPGQLATIAIYLRFLATGELKCEEDGRHFRPNHHAEAALQIEAALERLSTPETAWILRRIYPHLPSAGADFRRSEPLTRIRDIAHRNDIPPDLKKEIKHRLQNKLHRCAGPEDLRTSEEILGRVTAPNAGFSPGFVAEFKTFHDELRDFFNATALDERLRALGGSGADPAAIQSFLSLKSQASLADDELLDLLGRLTELRRLFDDNTERNKSQRRLADVGLEDYAFALLSECANRFGDPDRPAAWSRLLRALTVALDNLRQSLIEPEECAALRSELSAWAAAFSAADRFHLLRLLATLSRARRLAESYADLIHSLFPPRVRELGHALGVADHAVHVFCEGDLRGHLIFQLSRLVDLGLQATRQALRLPPWEPIVPGEAAGTLRRAATLAEVEGKSGPLLLLLDQADGDAEVPAAVKGVVLGHPLPHLSHLGVRARQARIPFAACADRDDLRKLDNLAGKFVLLSVTAEGLSVRETAPGEPQPGAGASTGPVVSIPEVVLAREPFVLSLGQAAPETCGAKASGARRLLELAECSGGLFRAPGGLAIPFGVMEGRLDAAPALRDEYHALRDRILQTPREELGLLLDRLRGLVLALPVPNEIGQAATAYFGPKSRLAVRSSANGEDLEHLAGAGLYDSVVNVSPEAAPQAVAEVWASLWTRRAALSRAQAGILHERMHMAVLVQELVMPDLSFILHTANPLTGNRAETLAELAVGLGEVLASASVPGSPYRMACDRKTGAAVLSACATFSVALRPSQKGGAGGVVQERLNYSRVPLSADPDAAPRLGRRLARIAEFLEERLGRPQDVEGVCVGDEVYIVQARAQQGL